MQVVVTLRGGPADGRTAVLASQRRVPLPAIHVRTQGGQVQAVASTDPTVLARLSPSRGWATYLRPDPPGDGRREQFEYWWRPD